VNGAGDLIAQFNTAASGIIKVNHGYTPVAHCVLSTSESDRCADFDAGNQRQGRKLRPAVETLCYPLGKQAGVASIDESEFPSIKDFVRIDGASASADP
jgi:hypothetical protein